MPLINRCSWGLFVCIQRYGAISHLKMLSMYSFLFFDMTCLNMQSWNVKLTCSIDVHGHHVDEIVALNL